jgi:hypothetical protein
VSRFVLVLVLVIDGQGMGGPPNSSRLLSIDSPDRIVCASLNVFDYDYDYDYEHEHEHEQDGGRL